jgi:hypothetical protein
MIMMMMMMIIIIIIIIMSDIIIIVVIVVVVVVVVVPVCRLDSYFRTAAISFLFCLFSAPFLCTCAFVLALQLTLLLLSLHVNKHLPN